MSDTPQAVIQEILNGDALSMSGAARKVPAHRGDAEHADPSCVWRWVKVGAKAPNGEMIKLEAARVAGRWVTSSAAMARFFERLTPADNSTPAPLPARKPAGRRKSIDAARRKLIAAR